MAQVDSSREIDLTSLTPTTTPGRGSSQKILCKRVAVQVEGASEMQVAPQDADGRRLQGAWRRTEDVDRSRRQVDNLQLVADASRSLAKNRDIVISTCRSDKSTIYNHSPILSKLLPFETGRNRVIACHSYRSELRKAQIF